MIVFISKFDPFDRGHTVYHVDRVLRETGEPVENGFSEVYVNAKADDGSAAAELMKYFKDSNGKNPLCPKLSGRVMQFKTEQKEVVEMCELMEKERLYGRELGLAEGKEKSRCQVITNMKSAGFTVEQISVALGITIDETLKLLEQLEV